MFQISAFSGVFPFVFTDDKLVLSYKFLLSTVAYLSFTSSTVMYNLILQFTNWSINFNTYAFIISFITPALLPLIIPTVSVVWLWINLKKFSKIFRALKRVEDITQNHDTLSYQRHYFAMSIIVIPVVVSECIFSYDPLSLTVLTCVVTVNAFLVMIQFISILATIRKHYSFLEDTLYNSTAMEWAQCHEILGSCCDIVNRCYSPQMFIFTLSSFSYTTSTVYILIAQTHCLTNADSILSSMWVIVFPLTVLVIVFHCQETVQVVSYI